MSTTTKDNKTNNQWLIVTLDSSGGGGGSIHCHTTIAVSLCQSPLASCHPAVGNSEHRQFDFVCCDPTA
jgi:hypothetical protein